MDKPTAPVLAVSPRSCHRPPPGQLGKRAALLHAGDALLDRGTLAAPGDRYGALVGARVRQVGFLAPDSGSPPRPQPVPPAV